MATTITNPWITLQEQRNGVTVQRKFAGLDTKVNQNDEVEYCRVLYWERELYPDGSPIKTELKYYELQDLQETINDVEGWRMEALPVLSGFVESLGMPGIVTPARETLAGEIALPVTAENGLILHRDTREKIYL